MRPREEAMAQTWLIDGYNLMHLSQQLRFEMQFHPTNALNHLLALLGDFAIRSKARVTVVFDGSPPDGPGTIRSGPAVNVRFVGAGQKADPVIRELVAASRDRRNLVVVSADREIVDYARVCGARVEHPRRFEERLRESPTPENGELMTKYERDLSEEEIREWLELFEGGDPDDEE